MMMKSSNTSKPQIATSAKDAPPAMVVCDNSKDGFVPSGKVPSTGLPPPPRPYVPPPIVSHHIVMAIGFTLFVSAYLWLPSVLVLFYVASQVIPYTFRTTDEGSERRKAYQAFLQDETVPRELRSVPEDVVLEERYWTNARYVSKLDMSTGGLVESMNGCIDLFVCRGFSAFCLFDAMHLVLLIFFSSPFTHPQANTAWTSLLGSHRWCHCCRCHYLVHPTLLQLQRRLLRLLPPIHGYVFLCMYVCMYLRTLVFLHVPTVACSSAPLS